MLQSLKYFPFIPAAILTALLVRLITSGLSWIGTGALVLAVLWFGFELVRWLMGMKDKATVTSHKKPEPREEPESLISLVYFLSEPRDPREETIRNCVASALNIDFKDGDPDAEHFVIQFTPPQFEDNPFQPVQHFMVRIPQGLFSVLVSHAPYISDPKSFAKDSIRDKRLRSAVESHRAWMSVDLMDENGNDPEVARHAYAVIGKILSSMAGPDCLAIYCPEMQRCNEFDLSLIEVLASGEPLQIFEEPTFEPIIEVADDDPRMAAAVEEAIERWPEFVREFNNREEADSEKYIIKAEFTENGKSEFMWVTVTALDSGSVRGILMNDPHELMDVHRGAEVEIGLERLNDWLYPGEDDEPVGGFTLTVLAEEENGEG